MSQSNRFQGPAIFWVAGAVVASTLGLALLITSGSSDAANSQLPQPTQPAPTRDRPLYAYDWEPIQSGRLLPNSPLPATISQNIKVRATPGEVEPASFVIHATETVEQIAIEIGDLAHSTSETRLPAAMIEPFVVKSWFQAGDGFRMRKGKKVLVPELLLKDDALIKVDLQRKKQWLRTTRSNEKIIDVPLSDINDTFPEGVEIHDAPTLQPFSLLPNESKQIWLTLRVPPSAPAGSYKAPIQISAPGVPPASLVIHLQVLPFTLEASRIETGLYYRGRLSKNPSDPRAWNIKEEWAYRRDIESLVDHGVLNPTFTHYGSRPPHTHLQTELAIRRDAGMPNGSVYVDGLTIGKPKTSSEFIGLERKVKHWVKWFRDAGYGPVYFYGVDEAKNDKLALQIPGWKRTRQLGGRVMTAGYVGSSEVAAPHLDMPILAYEPDPEEARRYHKYGQRVFSYANPQVGLEDPLVYRKNYGLSIWKAGYDGSMTYAYQHGYAEIWNDFDGKKTLRDHAFAYPTDSGIIETVQYEGFREAIDDLRYLATLQSRIEAIPSMSRQRSIQAWLDDLDLSLDLRDVRNQIIDKILELDR